MLNTYSSYLKNSSTVKLLFGGLILSIIIGILAGLYTQTYLLFALPSLYLGIYITIVDFRKVFYLLLISIPLSTELNLPGGFGTDFPSELLAIGLMGIFMLFVLRNGQQLSTGFFRHPITLLLVLHLAWIALTTLHAQDKVIAFKFLLAKIWYIVTYYFLAGLLLKSEKDIKTFFKCIFFPLLFTVIYVMLRHAGTGFSFETINFVLNPFYRNHVTYAAIMVVFFPFLWYAPTWYKFLSLKWWALIFSTLFFLAAIYLSFTRAAYIALFIAAGAYFIIKYRLVKIVLAASLIAGIIGFNYLTHHNKYLEYAPDYNKAIMHTKFDNLLEATAKGEDISTMERVYRWVAGAQMVGAKPLFGFGPGNFYANYNKYTVNSFQTYVSDNPEQSGIHCYYLMVAVEQGIPGLIIFILLCFAILLKGEALYHSLRIQSKRYIVLMTTLSFIIILALILINDMIEIDKVGAFFFMSMGILVNLDLEETAREKAS